MTFFALRAQEAQIVMTDPSGEMESLQQPTAKGANKDRIYS